MNPSLRNGPALPDDEGASSYEYNALMSSMQVSVSKHLLDEHFTLVWANDYYYRLIRYPRKEYDTKFHNDPRLYYDAHGYSEELRKLTETVVRSIAAGESGYSIVTRMPVKGGGHVWVRMTGTYTAEYVEGKQISYTVITDIDDLVRMRQSQTITYNNIPGFVAKVIVRENQLELTETNDQFAEFFGSRGNIDSDNPIFRKNIELNAAVLKSQRPAFRKGEPIRFLAQLVNGAGQTLWMQIRGECVDWIDKNPVYLLIYLDVTDLTDLRRMQARLEEQADQLKEALAAAEDANRAKSDFLSRMSHDIRTPMNAIVGMTEIAAAHLDQPDKIRDCLKKVTLSSQHLLGLINDVLDMSKIENGKMALMSEPIVMPDLLENVVAIIQPMIKARNQTFSIRLHNVVHERFLSDSLRLRQIFINLLSNSSKFTPPGGAITVDVEEIASEIAATARLRFLFADTGIGIKPEFLPRIFDAFSRERDGRVDKTEGTGLGMAITQKIVGLIGGTISVASEQGRGTTFTVELPLPIDTEPQPDWRLPPLKILIVDDDADMCVYTAEMLRDCGSDSEWVTSGEEALLRIRDEHRAGADYDVVILDWKMPGQDGVATVRRIRGEVSREVPILIVSAYDWSEIEAEALAAGADGFLSKPLFRSTIIRGISQYVLGRPAADTPEPQEHGYDFSGKTILLAEDNELNSEIAVELLSVTGAEVVVARDGAEALRTYLDAPAGAFDLILMDIQMPGMNGYQATRAIRAADRPDARTVPILAMTADAFAEDIAAARAAGMNGHIAKPIDVGEVKQKIAQIFGPRR